MFKSLINSKIMSIEEAITWRCKLEKTGKKLVMTNGCFDILHRGHVTYLMKARELGDALVLAINSDSSVRELKGPNRPVTNENDRAFILASLMFIDAVVIFRSKRCEGIINEIKPDIYVKGADYNLHTMDQTERSVLEDVGSKIEFISFVDGYSTTSIIKKMSN
ncbi:MAG: D-glycero-beta-D-manno-heptose 1-phosphate adenylyltransferase [Lentisphaerota bacterium]